MADNHPIDITAIPFEQEFEITASRSSGPGGQHVNKVSTRIELRFNIRDSKLLTEDQKDLIIKKLKNRINKDGELIIVSQESRSQVKNKEIAIAKFYELMTRAFIHPKKRKPTIPSKASKVKRMEIKRQQGVKKEQRKPPEIE